MSLPVYLVEDDDAVREGLALLLRTVGLDVRSFAGPSEFLSALDRLQPGCLILDIRMPHLSKGLTPRQIAAALALSPRTVDSHRAAIGAKAGTSSAAELTRLWIEARADR